MMNLMDLLQESGGTGSINALAKQLGIGGRETGSLVESLAPALMRGMQKQLDDPATAEGLTKALSSGNHQRYLDDPNLVASGETITDGNKILGHLFGSKDVSRNVAAQAAERSGLESSLVRKALPILAGLAMGAVSKKGQSSPGNLDGGLLGGLLGGLTGGDDDGFGIDDVLSLAKKLF